MAASGLTVNVPAFMTEIIAEISQQARKSPHVNQRSGVSARMSITNYETLVANATRRALIAGEREVVPRVTDLDAIVASTAGKVEIETIEDGREEYVLDRIVKAAVLDVFRARVKAEHLGAVVGAFEGGVTVNTGEDVPVAEYVSVMTTLAMAPILSDLEVGESPAAVAAAVEFVLEGMHLTKRLNKDELHGRATYRGRG